MSILRNLIKLLLQLSGPMMNHRTFDDRTFLFTNFQLIASNHIPENMVTDVPNRNKMCRFK